MLIEEHTVEWDEKYPVRVDKYLSEVFGHLSRSQLKNRMQELEVNGQKGKLSRTVSDGDVIRLVLSDPPSMEIEAEAIPLEVLYEDKNCLVINKPQGMVVHPANGNYTGTLVHGLLYYLANHKEHFQGETIRPGIVHRLDKDTSGVIITARNPESLEFLSRQFREKTTQKHYLAIIRGHLPSIKGQIEGFLTRDPSNRKIFTLTEDKGKASLTHWKVLKAWEKFSLVQLSPVTGRTHQLRVHMKAMGCPILGDPLYSRKDRIFPEATLCLHAHRLSIILPGEEQIRTFQAPLPEKFKSQLLTLKAL